MEYPDISRFDDDSNFDGDATFVRSTADAHRTNKNVSIQQTEPDAYASLKRAKTRYLTVEIPVMLTALPISLMKTFEAEYIRERISIEKNYTESATNCTAAGTSRGIEDEIQSETSLWLLYLALSSGLPSIFFSVFLGSLSDTTGRKPALAVPAIGVIIQAIIYLFIVHFDLPVPVFIAGEILFGSFGGVALLLGTESAYITDVCSAERRTFRIIVMESFFFVGFVVGQLALGYALQYSNMHTSGKYIPPLLLALGCAAVTLVYVMVPGVLLETVVRDGTNNEANKASILLRGMKDLLMVNTNGRRLKVIVYGIVTPCAIIAASFRSEVVPIYSLAEPFCFSALELSYLNVVSLISPGIGLVGGAFILPRILSDNWIIQLSLWNNILCCIIVAIANHAMTIFIGSGIGILSSISFPVMRSQLSKVARKHERGLMLTFLGVMDNIGSLLFPLFGNNIYAATVFFYPPFVFYFSVGFTFIPIAIIGILQYKERRQASYRQLSGADETE